MTPANPVGLKSRISIRRDPTSRQGYFLALSNRIRHGAGPLSPSLVQVQRRPNSQVSSQDRKPHDGGEQLARDEDPCHKQPDPKAGRQSLLQLRGDEGESGSQAAETGEPPGMTPRVDPGRPGEQGIAREKTDVVDDPAGENPAGAVERTACESPQVVDGVGRGQIAWRGLDGMPGWRRPGPPPR